MSQENQSINLKDKSVVELKAFAFDLQNTRQQYENAYQLVMQELQIRADEEQKHLQSKMRVVQDEPQAGVETKPASKKVKV